MRRSSLRLHGEIYRQLGVRPLINAAGTYTTLTGSLLVPQAREAMMEASKYFVPLIDLQLAAGARIAKLLGVPAAMVTSGGAGSILLATAACVAGKDPEKIRRIPDTTGMKNEVVMVKEHRMRLRSCLPDDRREGSWKWRRRTS